jgi:hypothetical protein
VADAGAEESTGVAYAGAEESACAAAAGTKETVAAGAHKVGGLAAAGGQVGGTMDAAGTGATPPGVAIVGGCMALARRVSTGISTHLTDDDEAPGVGVVDAASVVDPGCGGISANSGGNTSRSHMSVLDWPGIDGAGGGGGRTWFRGAGVDGGGGGPSKPSERATRWQSQSGLTCCSKHS